MFGWQKYAKITDRGSWQADSEPKWGLDCIDERRGRVTHRVSLCLTVKNMVL